MEIKIKGNAHELYKASVNTGHEGFFNPEWYDKMEAIAGMTIEVETEHLFADQFNTVPIDGVSTIGLRIFERYVDEVTDDEREYMLKCNYCGQMSEVNTVTSQRCPHCLQGDYLVPLSNEAKISFDYRMRAKAERASGGKCKVDESMGIVSITMSDESEYYFQGEEAEDVINEYYKIHWLSCSIEDYFLAIAQSW